MTPAVIALSLVAAAGTDAATEAMAGGRFCEAARLFADGNAAGPRRLLSAAAAAEAAQDRASALRLYSRYLVEEADETARAPVAARLQALLAEVNQRGPGTPCEAAAVPETTAPPAEAPAAATPAAPPEVVTPAPRASVWPGVLTAVELAGGVLVAAGMVVAGALGVLAVNAHATATDRTESDAARRYAWGLRGATAGLSTLAGMMAAGSAVGVLGIQAARWGIGWYRGTPWEG